MTCKLGLTEDVIVLLLYKIFLKYGLYKGFYSSMGLMELSLEGE